MSNKSKQQEMEEAALAAEAEAKAAEEAEAAKVANAPAKTGKQYVRSLTGTHLVHPLTFAHIEPSNGGTMVAEMDAWLEFQIAAGKIEVVV